MKSYKGPVILSCDKNCKKETRINERCLNCPHVKIELLDLDGKVIETKKVVKQKIVKKEK